MTVPALRGDLAVVVLDTSVLIDHLRGHEGAREAVRRAAEARNRMVASVLTKVEVLAGMRAPEERTVRRLLDAWNGSRWMMPWLNTRAR
jgi:predicted nucleic acid-binding protein